MTKATRLLRSRRFLVLAALGVIGALSAMDHAGLFGYRVDDRLRYDHVEAEVALVLDDGALELNIPDADRPRTRVKLMGVDAAGSDRAKAHLAAAVAGRRILLVLDPLHRVRDESGALLAYVYGGGRSESLNEALARLGLARIDPGGRCVLAHRLKELRRQAATRNVRP